MSEVIGNDAINAIIVHGKMGFMISAPEMKNPHADMRPANGSPIDLRVRAPAVQARRNSASDRGSFFKSTNAISCRLLRKDNRHDQ
jgi:hypothetical protein